MERMRGGGCSGRVQPSCMGRAAGSFPGMLIRGRGRMPPPRVPNSTSTSTLPRSRAKTCPGVTAAPVTAAPVTAAPVTAAPVTAAAVGAEAVGAEALTTAAVGGRRRDPAPFHALQQFRIRIPNCCPPGPRGRRGLPLMRALRQFRIRARNCGTDGLAAWRLVRRGKGAECSRFVSVREVGAVRIGGPWAPLRPSPRSRSSSGRRG